MSYLGEFEQLVLLAILQCAQTDEGAYTVPIGRLIAEKTGRDVARGALHTSLDRLATKGLVTSTLGEPLAIRGGRSRRYFTVTKPGMAALRESRAALTNLSAGLESVLNRKK
jgi:DNA-binding PadR family transcriptional regulator